MIFKSTIGGKLDLKEFEIHAWKSFVHVLDDIKPKFGHLLDDGMPKFGHLCDFYHVLLSCATRLAFAVPTAQKVSIWDLLWINSP